MLNAEPQTVQTNNGNLTVSLDPEFITLTLTPQIGDSITLGNNPPAKVLSLDSKAIILDYNSELAGQSLVLNVKILDKK